MNWKPINDFPDYLISDCGESKKNAKKYFEKRWSDSYIQRNDA